MRSQGVGIASICFLIPSFAQNLGLGVFEEKKPSTSSDEESDVDESIIINPFSAAVTDKNPGIILMNQDHSEDEGNSSSSDESAESSS